MSVTKKDNKQFKEGVTDWLNDYERKKKSIKKRIKCQILFSIYELDRLVDEILSELK